MAEMEPPIDDVDVDYDYFDEVCWPILGHRVKAFENLKVCIEFGTDLYQTIAYFGTSFQN